MGAYTRRPTDSRATDLGAYTAIESSKSIRGLYSGAYTLGPTSWGLQFGTLNVVAYIVSVYTMGAYMVGAYNLRAYNKGAYSMWASLGPGVLQLESLQCGFLHCSGGLQRGGLQGSRDRFGLDCSRILALRDKLFREYSDTNC